MCREQWWVRAGEDVWGSSCSRGMNSAPVEAPAWATEGLHSCDDFVGGVVFWWLQKTGQDGMRSRFKA